MKFLGILIVLVISNGVAAEEFPFEDPPAVLPADAKSTTPVKEVGENISVLSIDDIPAVSGPKSSEEISFSPAPIDPIPVNDTLGEKNATEAPVLDTNTTPKKKVPTKRPLSIVLNSNRKNETENSIFEENATKDAQNSTEPPKSDDQKSIPSEVRNPRVTVIGYTGKPVHTFNLTEKQILYQIRVFWLEPENWRDRGFRPPNRVYDLFCWLSNDGAWVHDLLRQNFSASIFAHSQWMAFPETDGDSKSNFTVDCGLRAINNAGKPSEWSFSVPIEIRQTPVFLRGFDNINVQGWSDEEVQHLVKTSVGSDIRRRDSPQITQESGNKKQTLRNGRNC